MGKPGNIDLEAGDGRMLPPGITITVQAGTGDKDSDSCSWSTIALVVVVLLCGAFFWHSKITEANREAKKSSGTSKTARREESSPEPKEEDPKKSSKEAKKSSEEAKKSSEEAKKSSEESEKPSEEPKKSSRLKIIGMAAGAISLLTMGYFGYNYYRYGEKPDVGGLTGKCRNGLTYVTTTVKGWTQSLGEKVGLYSQADQSAKTKPVVPAVTTKDT